MQNPMQVLAIRALLQKDGCADVHFELRRNSAFDFTMVENGKITGVFWRTVSPQQAMRGDAPMTLHDAWQACLSKRYPGYLATASEEAFQTGTA
jgi:hypothetical protein